MIENNSVIPNYKWVSSDLCSNSYLLPAIQVSFSNLNIKKAAQILDAGCGGGYILNRLSENGFLNLWGFDTSKSGIEIIQQCYKDIRDRVAIHNSYDELLPSPFPLEEYDLVLSTEVIEHLYSPQTYLKNIYGWLKEDGYIVMSTPYHGYLKNLAITITGRFDTHMTPLWEGGHIKFFSKKTLYTLLRENGFEPIEFKGCGRLPYLWKSMVVTARKK